MIVLALLTATTPLPLRTYDDWIVGCDNLRVCQADALAKDAPADDHLALVVRRDAEANAPASVTLPLRDVPAGERLTLRIGRKALATVQAPGGGGGLALPLSGEVLAALTNGAVVAVVDDRGRTRASASLKGLSAALLYIDETQQRVGTTTALRKPGRRSTTTIPLPPPSPAVMQPAVTGKPPRTLKVKNAVKLLGADKAVCPSPTRPIEPKAWRLDDAHSLVTIDHPCGNGAYNLYTSAFILDEKGRPTPARFDAATGFGDSRDNQVINGGWDARTRRITGFVRGRGLGDCGSQQSFAWDGASFRLVEQADMRECRGAMDYITTWRARVVVN